MAVPTIFSIDPTEGPTTGFTAVEILGENFRPPTILPPDPATNITPPSPIPVKVYFGGVESQTVLWITENRLYAITPPRTEESSSGTIIPVDVVVENVDDDGILIPGETVTLSDGFTYRYPTLNAYIRQPLTILTRSLIMKFRSYVHPNTVHMVNTDYDEAPGDGLNITHLASLPAIVLSGPDLQENRFYSTNEDKLEEVGGGLSFVKREPRTVDVTFDIMVISNSTSEILNLIHVLTEFIHQTKYCIFRPYPDRPDVVCELEFGFADGGDFNWTAVPNSSNIRQAKGTIIVRGFDFDGVTVGYTVELGESQIPGVPGNELPEFESLIQIGNTYIIGANPGDPTP